MLQRGMSWLHTQAVQAAFDQLWQSAAFCHHTPTTQYLNKRQNFITVPDLNRQWHTGIEETADMDPPATHYTLTHGLQTHSKQTQAVAYEQATLDKLRQSAGIEETADMRLAAREREERANKYDGFDMNVSNIQQTQLLSRLARLGFVLQGCGACWQQGSAGATENGIVQLALPAVAPALRY